MVQPRIAVVVPCYNAGETLDQTLESVRQQDVPVEIIVVDDGSTDASAEIARRFSPWARVIEGPNRGVSNARNRGIAETTAEWLVFLDADDLLKPGTLRRRLAPALEAEADVIICEYEELIEGAGGAFTVGARRRVDWQALRQDPEGAIASHVWTSTAALAYRRSLVEKIGGFRQDLPVIQDARLLFDAAFHGARMVGSDHVGAQYRIVPHSLSRRDPGVELRFNRRSRCGARLRDLAGRLAAETRAQDRLWRLFRLFRRSRQPSLGGRGRTGNRGRRRPSGSSARLGFASLLN